MLFSKKIFAIFIAPFFFLAPAFAFAQATSTATTTTSNVQVNIIADVNLQDCTYTQATSTSQLITINCSITNKLSNQGDIRYGVRLLKRTEIAQLVIDTKVYPEVLSLRENQTIQKQIEYVPPSYLSGEYKLLVILKTSTGLALSADFLGTVTLKSSTPYVEIKSDTCSLNVGTTTYTPAQRTGTEVGQQLNGICTVVSHNAGDLSVTPTVVIYEESTFGEAVSGAKDEQQPFDLKNNVTGNVSFHIPQVLAPKSYYAVLSLVTPDGITVSNAVEIPYTINGATATILNVLLDKDYYQTGDIAKVSVFWGGTARNVAISIQDGSDNSCTKETTFTAPASGSSDGLQDYSLPISRLCVNPQATIKIIDANGIVLTEKTVAVASGELPPNASLISFFKMPVVWYALVLLGIMGAITAFIFIKKQKNLPVSTPPVSEPQI